MTIGQGTHTAGLQLQNFNMIAATLKHPSIVYDYDKSLGKLIKEDRSCCDMKIFQVQSNIDAQHQLNVHGLPNAPQLHGGVREHVAEAQAHSSCDGLTSKSRNCVFQTEVNFPYDIGKLIEALLLPNVTSIQRLHNSMLLAPTDNEKFQDFIKDAFGTLIDIFEVYRIPLK